MKLLDSVTGLVVILSLAAYLLMPVPLRTQRIVPSPDTPIPEKTEEGPKIVCIDSLTTEQSEEELKKLGAQLTSEYLAAQINKNGLKDTIVIKLLIQARVPVKLKDVWAFIIKHYDYSIDTMLRKATRIDFTELPFDLSGQFHDCVHDLSGHPERYTLLRQYFNNSKVYTWLRDAIAAERQKLRAYRNKVERMDTSCQCRASFIEEAEDFPLYTICRMFFEQAKSFDSINAQGMGVAKSLVLDSLRKTTLSPGQDSIEVFKGIVRTFCPEYHYILEADESTLEDLVSFRNILGDRKG